MAISLNRFSAGETGYVAKFNTNVVTVETAINALEGAVELIPTGNTTTAFDEIWKEDGLIGASSFRTTCATSQTLSVTSGSVWSLSGRKRARATSNVTMNFAVKSKGSYYLIADGAGALSISAASVAVAGSNVAIWEVYYSDGNFSALTRQVPFLYDGDDYQRTLSSVTFGSADRLADRLSSIENALNLNTLYAQKTISGLTWDYKAGHIRDNNTITSTVSGTITLAASATHYIEVAISDATVSYNTAGYTSSNAIPVRTITTAASAVTVNNDTRTWATVGGGGGGGVAGLANSGTTDGLWQLYRTTGAGSAPVSDASFTVDRGSQANVEIRWNETNDQWEWTNDGASYAAFGDIQQWNIGTQQHSRFTALPSYPTVINVTEVTAASYPPYTALAFSAYVSTTTTAVLLRGFCMDSAPAASGTSYIGAIFLKDSATVVTEGGGRIFATYYSQPVAQMLVVPVSDQKCVYAVDASSDTSLALNVALLGYYDTITGVGTQLISATKDSLTASTGTNDWVLSTTQFSATMNRGMVTYLEVSGTIGAGSLYDVEIYGSNLAAADQLMLQLLNVDASAAYTTRLPFGYRDLASTNQLYIRISNAGASAGLFSLHLQGEKWA